MLLVRLILFLAFAVPPEPVTITAANAFAAHYNEWGNFRRVPGTIDAKEIRAWRETQQAWNHLNSTIKY